MENLNTPKKPIDTTIFTIFMVLVVFFTTSDLVANIVDIGIYKQAHSITALIFSLLSGFFVFLGTAFKKKRNIEKGINAKIDYINRNFSWGASLLSALDIICSIIAIFTAIVALGVIFRAMFALRLIVTINKVRMVVQAILLTIIGYLSLRSENIKKKYKESRMKAFFKKIGNGITKGFKYIFVSNPQFSLATLVNALLSATVGVQGLPFGLAEKIGELGAGGGVLSIVIAIALFCIVEVCGIKWAIEPNAVADERKKKEKEQKVNNKKMRLEKKEAKRQQKAEAIKLEKAKALLEQQKAELLAQEKKIAEEAEIKALAEKLKNEQEQAQTQGDVEQNQN